MACSSSMSGVQRFIHPMRCFTAVVGMLSGKYISDSSFLVYERIENVIIMLKPHPPNSLTPNPSPKERGVDSLFGMDSPFWVWIVLLGYGYLLEVDWLING